MSRGLRGLVAGPVRRLMRAGSRPGVSAAGPAKRGGLAAWVGGAEERGAAVVEFVVVFLALLVPLVYAIVVMADVQRAMLATSSAAREVGRVYVTAGDRPAAVGRVERVMLRCLAALGCGRVRGVTGWCWMRAARRGRRGVWTGSGRVRRFGWW